MTLQNLVQLASELHALRLAQAPANQELANAVSDFVRLLADADYRMTQALDDHSIHSLLGATKIRIIESLSPTTPGSWTEGMENSDALLPKEVVEQLEINASESAQYDLADRAGISYSTVRGTRGNTTLMFYFPSSLTHRYAVVTLAGSPLSQASIEALTYLVKELFLHFRLHDSRQERGSTLAQTRHAVLAPLSAAFFSLQVFQAEFESATRRPGAWGELLKDAGFRELVPSAIALLNQAVLFVQTSRYLLTSPSDIGLNLVSYDIVKLVNGVKKSFNWQIQDRRLTFRLQVRGTPSQPMIGDETMLWIVVSNLLDNAIKYAHQRTEICIAITYSKDKYLFEIKNHGVYLSVRERDRIFKPFTRGSQITNLHRRPGTGLGLPVAQMILQAHSETSSLEFWSRSYESPQAETVFSFQLPYQPRRTE